MKKIILLGVFQIAAILGWAGYHEYVRQTAPTFRIPLSPVDPFDVLRGRYFILNPQDARIKSGGGRLDDDAIGRFLASEPFFHGPALVGFCPEGEAYRVCNLARLDASPSGPESFWVRAFVTLSVSAPNWFITVDFGLDRFFLPNRVRLPGGENNAGWELEVLYRPRQSLLAYRLWFGGQPFM